MAAAYRSIGVNAKVSPESDEKTLDLSAKFTSGEECLPQRIVLGNFLKIITDKNFDPSETAFLLPTSSGPCRFGQYAPFITKVIHEMGHKDITILSPTSSDGYGSLANNTISFLRTAWRALIISDILRKILLIFRPYEQNPGEADLKHKKALKQVSKILENGSLNLKSQIKLLTGSLEQIRDEYLQLPLKQMLNSRPLIGVVGEIFLRFNNFSNQDILKKIETSGGEAWIADITEWIWYTNDEEKRKFREAGKKFSLPMFKALVRHHIQSIDEKKLLAPFKNVFKHRPEASMKQLLKYSLPYLPSTMALGEMTLNAAKAIDFYHSDCDGVIDISPFTCMNGIVTEVIYPQLSKNYDNIPIRIFYFDGVPFDLERDLEIFMDQVNNYKSRKEATLKIS